MLSWFTFILLLVWNGFSLEKLINSSFCTGSPVSLSPVGCVGVIFGRIHSRIFCMDPRAAPGGGAVKTQIRRMAESSWTAVCYSFISPSSSTPFASFIDLFTGFIKNVLRYRFFPGAIDRGSLGSGRHFFDCLVLIWGFPMLGMLIEANKAGSLFHTFFTVCWFPFLAHSNR